MELYDFGLLDPAWHYDDEKNNDPAMGGITYPVMTTEEMASIPLHKAFKKDSALGVWVTMPKLMDGTALTVINGWGFRPITALFVWVKLTKKGSIHPYGTIDFGMSTPHWEEDKNDANEYEHIKIAELYSGLGHHTNSNIEIMVLAKKGKGVPRLNKNVKQLMFAPLRKHSEKPRVQYKRLTSLYGDDIRRVELFARKQNPPPEGWDVVGLDYGSDIREWIKQYENM